LGGRAQAGIRCADPDQTQVYLPRDVFFGRLGFAAVFFSVWVSDFGRFFPATSELLPQGDRDRDSTSIGLLGPIVAHGSEIRPGSRSTRAHARAVATHARDDSIVAAKDRADVATLSRPS